MITEQIISYDRENSTLFFIGIYCGKHHLLHMSQMAFHTEHHIQVIYVALKKSFHLHPRSAFGLVGCELIKTYIYMSYSSPHSWYN